MSDRTPDEIWEEGLDEGERRLRRGPVGLLATSFAGGAEVFLSLLVLVTTTAGLQAAMPEASAHVLASLAFGVGFAFITIGRAELFTENFLIPVGAVFAGRAPARRLATMWPLSLLGNLVALTLFCSGIAVHGVLTPEAGEAAGTIADTLADRSALAAFLSAVLAGVVMTLFTWVISAAEGSAGRIAAALVVGFVLAVPSLNHAVVGFAEVLLGILCGTSDADLADLVRNTAIAVVGNTVGGVGIVFSTRLAQVRGEPDSGSGYRQGAAED